MFRDTTVHSAPDFFIIGAPKCGTNAIFSYLAEHPWVFVPQLKEPHFYSTDLPGLAQVEGQEHYDALFEGRKPGSLSGEASVWYLFSSEAPRNILKANPNARFVVMLRNPVSAAHALHSQLLRGAKENVLDFEEAWHLQFERRRGMSLPAYCPEPRCLQYREVFSYGPQLKRLLAAVPADQVKMYVFEEFFSIPKQYYLNLLQFLGLENDFRRDFSAKNSNRVIRNRFFGMLLARMPATFAPGLNRIRKASRGLGLKPAAMFDFVATKPAARMPLRKEFRRYLAAEFASDVEELEDMFGRPLIKWRERDCFSPISSDTDPQECVQRAAARFADRTQLLKVEGSALGGA